MRGVLDEVIGTNRKNIVFEQSLGIFFFALLTGFSTYMMRKKIIGVSRYIEYEIRKVLFQKLTYQDFDFFHQHQTGDLISRCTNDLEHVRVLLGPGIMYIPNSLSRLFFFLPLLYSVNSSLTLALMTLIFFIVILIIVIMPRLKPLHKRLQEHVGKINDFVWQDISGIQTIKLYTCEGSEKKRFKELNQNYIKKHMSVMKYDAFLWPFFLTLFGVSEYLLLRYGGEEVILGNLSLGELLQFNVMISILTFPVLSLGWVMSALQQGISALERIDLILNQPVRQLSSDWKSLDFKKGESDLSVNINNLNYTYPNAERSTLNGISLNIEAGETIGITGPIGSGKSTLINLLTGVLRPEKKGQLFLNGVDVLELNPEEHYLNIALVPQESFLFSKSIEQNIALNILNPEQTLPSEQQEKVVKVSKETALHEEVLQFPNQYEEFIGERGVTLSGGQRQRTAIARALFKEAPILIFDDSLSAVDSKTEQKILEKIKQIKGKQSLIIVSHRVSALKLTDKIIVIQNGKIEETGTHEQLKSNRNFYAKLTQMQKMEQSLREQAIIT